VNRETRGNGLFKMCAERRRDLRLLGLAAMLCLIAMPSARADDKVCNNTKQACYSLPVYNEINNQGGGWNAPMTVLLLHMFAGEMAGHLWCKIGRDPGHGGLSYNWGPTQVNNGAMGLCGGLDFARKVSPKTSLPFTPCTDTTYKMANGQIHQSWCEGGVDYAAMMNIWAQGVYECQNNDQVVANAAVGCSVKKFQLVMSCPAFVDKLYGYQLGHCRVGGCDRPGSQCYAHHSCDKLGTTKQCNSGASMVTIDDVPQDVWADPSTTPPHNAAPYSQAQMDMYGNQSMNLPRNCVNLKLMQALSQAVTAHQSFKAAYAGQFFSQQPIRNMKQCIQRLLTVYSVIQKILNGSLQSAVGKIILGIVGYVVQLVMTAVCNAIKTAINDLLGMVCLPIPPMITLPTLASTGCLIGSGTSLGNLIMGLGNLMATPTGGTISVPGMPPLNVPLGRNICRQVTGGSTVCEP